jgi:SAM-dependent methyltransferase
MTLWNDFLTNNQRVIHKWKHYFPAYERHFSKFINQDVVFLEIGCGEGGSLQMWKRFLGPHARIIGIDIKPESADFAEDQIQVRIGNQADPVFLNALVKEFGHFDIVLDDGSHQMPHIRASFDALYPHVTRNGVYMVEDLHAAYWPEFQGGLNRPGSFIEHCKELIDRLHADYTKDELKADDFSRSTLSMHFYDSIAVFEKGRMTPRAAPMTGQVQKKRKFF